LFREVRHTSAKRVFIGPYWKPDMQSHVKLAGTAARCRGEATEAVTTCDDCMMGEAAQEGRVWWEDMVRLNTGGGGAGRDAR